MLPRYPRAVAQEARDAVVRADGGHEVQLIEKETDADDLVGHAVDFIDEIGEFVRSPGAPVRLDDGVIVVLDIHRDRESGIELELDLDFRLELERGACEERERARKVKDGPGDVERQVQREPLAFRERLARFESV